MCIRFHAFTPRHIRTRAFNPKCPHFVVVVGLFYLFDVCSSFLLLSFRAAAATAAAVVAVVATTTIIVIESYPTHCNVCISLRFPEICPLPVRCSVRHNTKNMLSQRSFSEFHMLLPNGLTATPLRAPFSLSSHLNTPRPFVTQALHSIERHVSVSRFTIAPYTWRETRRCVHFPENYVYKYSLQRCECGCVVVAVATDRFRNAANCTHANAVGKW